MSSRFEDDLIDFPCSDDWRDYYYERGFTKFPSPRYSKGNNSENSRNLTEKLESLIKAIEEQNKILRDLLDFMVTKEMENVYRSQKKSKTSGGSLRKLL